MKSVTNVSSLLSRLFRHLRGFGYWDSLPRPPLILRCAGLVCHWAFVLLRTFGLVLAQGRVTYFAVGN
jgi:hypothetical protein